MRRLLAFVLVFFSVAASAQDARLKFLIKRLQTASDARGRAQAALILGASGEAQAVQPLCGALSDKEELVRSAAANALAELGDGGGLDCLRKQVKLASGDSRAAMQKAIATLGTGGGQAPKFYISVAPVNDDRSSPDAASAKLVEELLRKQLQKMGAAIAPEGQSKKEAMAVLKSKKVRGYLIRPKLQSAGSGIRLALVGLTYPDNRILGEVSVKASGGNAGALIRALVPAVVKDAASTFEWGATQ